jgi:hypothetical protein
MHNECVRDNSEASTMEAKLNSIKKPTINTLTVYLTQDFLDIHSGSTSMRIPVELLKV